MKKIFSIASIVFKESVRHRIIFFSLALSFLIIILSLTLNPLALGELNRLVKDSGLSTISLFSLFIIFFSGTRLIFQEIEKKTIFVLITKPVSRDEIILGKFFGLFSIIFCFTFLTSLFFILILTINKITFNITLFYSIVNIFLQSILLSSIAIFYSTFSTPVLSSIFTFFTYVAGFFVNNISYLIQKAPTFVLKIFLKFVMLVIPNFYYLDIKVYAVNNIPISLNFVIYSFSYTFIYTCLLLYVSILIFRKKEFV
ncbi:MAG: ABC transporter permease [candidate division WOR-3 bacterium]